MKQWITRIAALTLTATAAWAIQPVTWTHTTEADFQQGETDDTIITSLGDIKLATGSETLGDAPDGVTIIYDMARVGETLYLAAGPQGRLLQQKDDELVEVAALEGEQIFALEVFNGELFVAISAQDKSRIAVLREGVLETHAELPGVRYVWDLAALPSDGRFGNARFVVVTGTEGKVLFISGGKVMAEALDAEQSNILSLAVGQDAIYVGTDTDGLVYRIRWNQQTNAYETFVIYDAGEPEIGALLVTDDGTVYVGTADAEQARPGRLDDAVDEETGRPAPGTAPGTEASEDADPGEAEQAPAPPKPVVPNTPPDAEPIEAVDVETQDEAEVEEPVEPVAEVDLEVEVEAAAPTAEQYDQLRNLMRKRLEAARKSGQLQVDGLQSSSPTSPAASSTQRARPTQAAPQPKEGNAVYRIDTDGFVREVFRESVMILRIIAPAPGTPGTAPGTAPGTPGTPDGPLLVATGNEGQVYRVDPSQDETTVLIDLDSEQVVAALVDADGSILLGAANPATLLRLDDPYAPKGTYTSLVMDAQQVSLFGTLTVAATLSEGNSVTVETRSGNTADPKAAAISGAWSPWSQAQVFMPDVDLPPLQPREMKIASPPARFLQYRLTLAGNVTDSPAVERVEMTYVTPNLRPAITSLTASYPEASLDDPSTSPSTEMNIEWETADPNSDPLVYTLEYRPAASDKYLLLAENVMETSHSWATERVPDGRYLLRVTADDRPANPGSMARTAARVSDPVLVDNTPPALEVKIDTKASTLTLTGQATDTYSKIARLAYSLDGDEEYVPILPDDLIFDSTGETFSVTIRDLAKGSHVVSLRVIDARGNTTHRSVLVD